MRFIRHLPFLSLAAASNFGQAEQEQHIFSNPPSTSGSSSSSSSRYKIPTAYESAVLGRRVLALTPLGTLSTVFPSSTDGGRLSGEEHRPDGLAGAPVGMLDYVADCEDDGNPTILAISIATSFKNVREGSNISLAQQWTPRYPPDKRIRSAAANTSSSSPSLASSFLDWLLGRRAGGEEEGDEGGEGEEDPVPYSAANLPRYSLIGYLEKIDSESTKALSTCFVDAHPDAKYWLPGNPIHESEFVRLVVTQIYWVGGFGDRAYIGWIDPADWKNVTREEWEAVSLPGEKKGWKEWSFSSLSLSDL